MASASALPPNATDARWAIAAALLLALLLFTANPVGFVDGGQDDYRYLLAARCVAEHGACLPLDHWARRWPLVLPTALAVRMGGESIGTLMLVPLGYAIACVTLLTVIVGRAAGAMAGCAAGAIFALTPLVGESASQLGVDLPELAFLLGAVLLLQCGHDRRDWRAFALAGLLAGIALQVRPTAFAALPVLAFAAWRARAPHALPAFLVGGALPSLVEAACYAAAAGDPLLGWRLSLGHGRIPSSELPASVDVRRSPLFNPAFIAGWKRPLGIHVHWAVDGLINYLLHPAVALTLGAAAALLALERRLLRGSDQAARLLRAALTLAGCWFVVLTYALAIDPKPRMFLPVLAAAAAVLGVALTRRARTGRLLVVAVTALIAGKGVLALAARTDTRALQAAAPSVIATTPGLAIDPRTAQYLALVPAARVLPPADPVSTVGPVLLVGLDDCARAAAAEGYRGWRVGRQIDPSPPVTGPVATLQRAGVFADRAPRPLLCTLTPWPGADRAAPPPR